MNGYIKKTEIPSLPANMSNYIHKNDLHKHKPFWHNFLGLSDMFKKHFVKNRPEPIRTEHSHAGSKKKEVKHNNNNNTNEPDSYGQDKHMPVLGSNTLRPANAFMCNGYSPQKTDSCYYY